jgi:predicted O-methyltransferase YrrM
MIDVLDFLSNVKDRKDLGLIEPINLDQKRMPIRLSMTRKHLAKFFREMGYRRIVEIGVSRGIYSGYLTRQNPEATIWSIDPWRIDDEYQERGVDQEMMEGLYLEAQERLAGTNAIIWRKRSLDAVKEFESESIDAVYIDGDHELYHVIADIYHWEKIVRPGGIVAGHDFARYPGGRCHVKDAVLSWTYNYRIRPWFVCRWRNSSWFWVKS